jgi:hypothetical protein
MVTETPAADRRAAKRHAIDPLPIIRMEEGGEVNIDSFIA